MALEWQGRYRRLISAIIRHSNVVNRSLNTRRDMGDGILLSTQELQILENLISREGENRIMSEVAKECGIPQSSMSKAALQLLNHELVSRYRMNGNMKSIVLRPTEKGKLFYKNYVEREAITLFEEFFEDLSSISDEQLFVFCTALEALNKKLETDGEQKLVEF